MLPVLALSPSFSKPLEDIKAIYKRVDQIGDAIGDVAVPNTTVTLSRWIRHCKSK
jgi:hypothetical protein